MRMIRTALVMTALVIATLAQSSNNGGGAAVAACAGGTNSVSAAQETIPVAPSELTATEVTSSSITIAWRDNSSDESGFKIERCGGPSCSDFTQIGTMPAGVTNITDWGLGKNKTFKYRVRAFNSAGDSAYSNIATATTTR